MTDTKPIIINNIDVSRCEYLQKTGEKYDCSCYAEEGAIFSEVSCSACPNCYYKRLVRLRNQYNAVVEQNESLQAELKARISECEDWRDKYYTSTTEVKADLMRQIEEKTQECEELYKEKLKLIDEKLELKCKVSKLIDENATKEVTYKINGKCVKTTADKVKEITAIIQGKDCKYSRCLKALKEIKEIIKKSVDIPCMEHNCDCENCKDECTENGRTCMRYGLKKILEKCEVAEVHMPSSLSLSLRERAGVRGQ